jgi:protein required for attachment to host cells
MLIRGEPMNRYLVAAIDGSRARFLKFKPLDALDHESAYSLVEHKALFNPTNELQGKELWASTKTGRNQGSGSQAHAYDDHRQNHLDEYERRFAQMIADEIISFTESQNIRQLLLIAESQTLGTLREVALPLLPKNLQIQEIAKDLCKLKPSEIHEYLVSKNFLPSRKKIS